MKQALYKILENTEIAAAVYRMRLEGDTSELKRGGQFVDVALEGRFLRRPFAATCWNATEMTIIYKVVGEGTAEMAALAPGSQLDVLTGLGNGFDADAPVKAAKCPESPKALVVTGGLGSSPAFSLVKTLCAKGVHTTVIMGFNKAEDIVLTEEYKALGADVTVVTMDGSVGTKGLVTDAIDALNPEYDYFYTCGPKVMMKAVCAKLQGPGEASLEERMGCGCGICYGCTCHTAKGPKRVCADGPVFKKEDIIW